MDATQKRNDSPFPSIAALKQQYAFENVSKTWESRINNCPHIKARLRKLLDWMHITTVSYGGTKASLYDILLDCFCADVQIKFLEAYEQVNGAVNEYNEQMGKVDSGYKDREKARFLRFLLGKQAKTRDYKLAMKSEAQELFRYHNRYSTSRLDREFFIINLLFYNYALKEIARKVSLKSSALPLNIILPLFPNHPCFGYSVQKYWKYYSILCQYTHPRLTCKNVTGGLDKDERKGLTEEVVKLWAPWGNSQYALEDMLVSRLNNVHIKSGKDFYLVQAATKLKDLESINNPYNDKFDVEKLLRVILQKIVSSEQTQDEWKVFLENVLQDIYTLKSENDFEPLLKTILRFCNIKPEPISKETFYINRLFEWNLPGMKKKLRKALLFNPYDYSLSAHQYIDVPAVKMFCIKLERNIWDVDSMGEDCSNTDFYFGLCALMVAMQAEYSDLTLQLPAEIGKKHEEVKASIDKLRQNETNSPRQNETNPPRQIEKINWPEADRILMGLQHPSSSNRWIADPMEWLYSKKMLDNGLQVCLNSVYAEEIENTSDILKELLNQQKTRYYLPSDTKECFFPGWDPLYEAGDTLWKSILNINNTVDAKEASRKGKQSDSTSEQKKRLQEAKDNYLSLLQSTLKIKKRLKDAKKK